MTGWSSRVAPPADPGLLGRLKRGDALHASYLAGPATFFLFALLLGPVVGVFIIMLVGVFIVVVFVGMLVSVVFVGVLVSMVFVGVIIIIMLVSVVIIAHIAVVIAMIVMVRSWSKGANLNASRGIDDPAYFLRAFEGAEQPLFKANAIHQD